MSYSFLCEKCHQSLEEQAIKIKGFNDAKLCYKCGHNICSKCQKKETRTEQVQEWDCTGREILVEVEISMFSQKEKGKNSPNSVWFGTHYCDEHKDEGSKSPYLWTKKDQEQLEKLEREREKEQERLRQETTINILNNPTEWSLFCGFSNEDAKIVGTEEYGKDLWKKFAQNLITVINSNPKDWKIQKIVIEPTGSYWINGEREVLIDQSCQIKYDERGNLIVDSGKIHMKESFTNEEWLKIQQILNNSINSNFSSKNNHSTISIIVSVSFIFLFFSVFLFLVKKKKKK